MISTSDPQALTGLSVIGTDGEKLGKVETIYLDTETDKPEWAAVKTGFFGGNVSLVPLATAEETDGQIRVPYAKDQVKNSPHHDPDAELTPADEAQLFEHYGVPYTGETVTADTSKLGNAPQGRAEGAVGRDTSGPTTDNAMTRSEEQLHVGTEKVEYSQVRLRKYIVTEHVTQTVPVSHEEVRLEREPITDENRGAALDGPAISEEEHEVVLYAERPVVAKETVPVERVRLSKETVTGEHQVSEEVRKEQIDTDGA